MISVQRRTHGSSTTYRTFGDLPLELLHIIISFLADDDKRHVKSLSRVCRYIRPAALEHLNFSMVKAAERTSF